jgi:pimeloyl-ACP methyl ester carboxylesterase
MHRFAAAVIAAALVLVACSGEDDASAPPTTTTTTTAVPVPEHGALLDRDEVEAGLDVPTYRVTYASTSPEDEPIEVTGLVAVPAEPRAILTWAHGTTGLDDACAPSLDPPDAIGWMGPLVEEGWVVAATDYEGLGSPGLHPYLHGTSEGRSTLDIVRAATELAGEDLPVLVWGHSQGGHSALWAGQLAAEWTPELDVRGVVAGAPASELPLISNALRNGGGAAGFLAMLLVGWAEAEPERADLDLILTPEAKEALTDATDPGCTADFFAAVGGLEGRFTTADPVTTEPWASMFEENDAGHVVTDIPILLLHGESDGTAPPILSQLLHDRVCGLGQQVERRTYPGADHRSVIGASWKDMVAWMNARLAGEPPASTCPSSPAG